MLFLLFGMLCTVRHEYWTPITTLEEMRLVVQQDVLFKMRHSPHDPYSEFHSMAAFWIRKGEYDIFSNGLEAARGITVAPEDALVLLEHFAAGSPASTFVTLYFGKGRFRLPEDNKDCGGRYTEVLMYTSAINITRWKSKVTRWLNREERT